jgi:hypothetical protein
MVGYKIWLSVGLLLGEGAYVMAKAALLGELDECIGCCCAAGVVYWLGEEPPSWLRQHCLVRADQLTILVDIQRQRTECRTAALGAVWLSVGLLLGEGAYAMAKAALLAERDCCAGCCCFSVVLDGQGSLYHG